MRALALFCAVVIPFSLAVPAVGAAAPEPRAAVVKNLDFTVSLHLAETDVHSLPDDVSYGQSRLIGTTTWGRRHATVEWLCSHVSDGGAGPSNDLVTITRTDGAVLALSVTGWVSSGRLHGTVEVIGGKGRYRGAEGTGTARGRQGTAVLSLTVTQPGHGERTTDRGWAAPGC